MIKLSRRFSIKVLAVGDRIMILKHINKTDIDDFARLSGDTNYIHFGDRPLVHGVYLAGLVSGVIGTKLPGMGSVLVSKNIRFPNACYAGDQVKIEVEIQSIRKLIKCGFWCIVGDKVVMEGTANVINKNIITI
jgi:3-hydroxybutyryl-CoA dehydratase